MNGSNMNNRNYEEYLIEYLLGDALWAASIARSEQEAFDKLEICKKERPKLKWSVTKITHTYTQLLRTPEHRTVEI